MSANTAPIFPVAPLLGIASLTAPNAIASRANVVTAAPAAASYAQLTPITANGARVDSITVSAKGSTVAGALDIWLFDGAKLVYFTSFDITANTASTTNDPFTITRTFTSLVLPPTYQLYVSAQVQQDFNVYAFGGSY